jgi:hypothetical protein
MREVNAAREEMPREHDPLAVIAAFVNLRRSQAR